MRQLLAAFAALVAMGTTAAQATPGFSTADVNIRSGPDIDFPSVGVIPEGDPVNVRGCLRDESWCDVLWDGNRGWVYSEYLALDYRGNLRPLPDLELAAISIPFVTFVAADYWHSYYRDRPWYRDRDRWIAFRPRPRPDWRAPPPGPRQPGWWRSGYRAPGGMRPPAEHWRRPDRRAGPGFPDRRGGRAEEFRPDMRGAPERHEERDGRR